MATRRMFSNRIANSARFLQMPAESQLLYFHLCLRADDDGIAEAYPVMQLLGSAPDSFKVLLAKGLIQQLNEDQVIVVVDWLEHNTIRADRKVDSIYKHLLDARGIQTIPAKPRSDVDDNSRRLGGQSTDSISKDKLSKDNRESLSFLDKVSEDTINEMTTRFRCDDAEVKTKAHALADYCRAKGKKYKDYKSMLGNALRKDFGERPPQRKVEIIDGVAHIVG